MRFDKGFSTTGGSVVDVTLRNSHSTSVTEVSLAFLTCGGFAPDPDFAQLASHDHNPILTEWASFCVSANVLIFSKALLVGVSKISRMLESSIRL